jgi:hypothetical protein
MMCYEVALYRVIQLYTVDLNGLVSYIMSVLESFFSNIF